MITLTIREMRLTIVLVVMCGNSDIPFLSHSESINASKYLSD